MLVGDNPQKTKHPKIKKINDPFIPYEKLERELRILKQLINENRSKQVKQLLEKLLKSYKSNSKIVDHLFLEKRKSNLKS